MKFNCSVPDWYVFIVTTRSKYICEFFFVFRSEFFSWIKMAESLKKRPAVFSWVDGVRSVCIFKALHFTLPDFIWGPLDSTVSEDSGIESMTVATLAMVRFHPFLVSRTLRLSLLSLEFPRMLPWFAFDDLSKFFRSLYIFLLLTTQFFDFCRFHKKIVSFCY